MTTQAPGQVVDWLLDSDPAIRWQVLRDLVHAPEDEVAAERARVAEEGWGGALLDARDPDGQWKGGAYFPARSRVTLGEDGLVHGQPWTSTLPVLVDLRDFGVDPQHPRVRESVALVAENCRWEHDGQRFFDGEVEPCINGRTVTVGSYFGADVRGLVDRLVGERLPDGGWNCDAERGSVRSSFDSTVNVLEGLLEHERATGGSDAVREARRTGEEYLLQRALMRRLSTGEVVDESYLAFSFPPRWQYDVLRALEYFRAADVRDPRLAEAVELVRAKRQADGRWLLEDTHEGEVHFRLDDGDGSPSRWNTLRATRVLDWWDGVAG